MRTQTFCQEAIAEHKVEEYKSLIQDYWRSSKPNLTICRSKNRDFAFLVNTFNVVM